MNKFLPRPAIVIQVHATITSDVDALLQHAALRECARDAPHTPRSLTSYKPS